jgi:Flp pilus assembly pilin Flp
VIFKKLKNERGATSIEYGLIAALMVIVMIPAMQLDGMYDQITNKIVAAIAASR